MKDGFVKVAAASLDIRVADCEFNAQQCIAAIERAAKDHVRVLVLPELVPAEPVLPELEPVFLLPQPAKSAMTSTIARSRAIFFFMVCFSFHFGFTMT